MVNNDHFYNPIGFSLSAWLTNRGEGAGLNPLRTFLQSELLKDYGIENMMKSPSCSRTTGTDYVSAGSDGWNLGKFITLFESKDAFKRRETRVKKFL